MDPSANFDVLGDVPKGKPTVTEPVNHLALTFDGNTNGMLNKIYEYVRELHANTFPDHSDHQE